jgi:hypothetical protein
MTPYSVSYHKQCLIEKFTELPLQLSRYNRLSGRDLSFKPPHSQSLASQRSETEKTLSFDTSANCTTLSIPKTLNNEAQSLMSENDILYKFTSSCFSFKAKELRGNNLHLSLNNTQDWFKYVFMILLNPVMLEINKDNFTTTSFAYYPSNRTPKPITNRGHGDFAEKTTSYEDSILNLKLLTGGSLFNYRMNKNFTDISEMKINDNDVNVKVFYVRPHDTTQSVGTAMKYSDTPKSGRYQVTRLAYDVIGENDSTRPMIMFSKTIDKYFNENTRNKFPTFTTTFKLKNSNTSTQSVTGQTKVIFEMYMNNMFGMNSSCNTNLMYPPSFAKNGNIFSIAIQYTDNPNLINLIMGTSVGGCLFQGNTIKLTIPYFNKNSTDATCTLTFSPYTIDFLGYWVNPMNDKKENIEFIYHQNVTKNENDFTSLFIGPFKSNLIKFNDIFINTDTSFITHISEVQLGQKNLAEILYKAIHLGQ